MREFLWQYALTEEIEESMEMGQTWRREMPMLVCVIEH